MNETSIVDGMGIPMEAAQLKDIIAKHAQWLHGENGGMRADLSEADLHGAKLSEAALSMADLHGADLSWADLSRADLSRADLSWADLSGAQLSWADLSRADLSWADLSMADLSMADLHGAKLYGAKLSEVVGLSADRCTPLRMLLDQPGAIRAYKLVTAAYNGPFKGSITYRIGETYTVAGPNRDETVQCGEGINLATLDWCLREWEIGYHILIAEFVAADIAAIPIGTDGKFRVQRCTIVEEVPQARIDTALNRESSVNG